MEAAASKAKRAGNVRFQAGDFAQAQRLYSQGIEYGDALPPQLLAQLYLNRSATHLKLAQLGAAKDDANCAAALAPQWGKPHVRLAEVHHAKCKYAKAVDELEIALGLGAAAQDDALVADVHTKMDEYRLLKDAELRAESQNLAYSPAFTTTGAYRETMQASAGLSEHEDPNELLDKILKMKLDSMPGLDRHVLLGHQALRDGRYHDAAREYLAAAVSGNAEGMYNYACLLESGRGVPKDIGEAVKWLERASQVTLQDHGSPNLNCGIGEAMSSLARHHHLGIYYPQNDAKAVELWQRAAVIGSVAALNALGVLHMNGLSGVVPKDLPLARDYLRQAAEKFSNEAMLNLADLHASIQDYDVAVRWADSAHRFGFLRAATAAQRYRELAAMRPTVDALDPRVKQGLEETASIARMPPPTVLRDRETPSLNILRATRTPYVRRLCAAKEAILDAASYLDEGDVVMSAAYAVQARRIPDSNLVFEEVENVVSFAAAKAILDTGIPLDAGLALLLPPPDAESFVSFFGSLHQQFPDDLALLMRAACFNMFEHLPGSDRDEALRLFDKAFVLLPNPDDDADPFTLDLLSTAGPANFHLYNLPKAKSFLTRFVEAATHDGHRKVPEAHFHLGLIAMADAQTANKAQRKKILGVAVDHLRTGKAFEKTLPTFLQPTEPLCNERMLSNVVRMVSVAMEVPVDLPHQGANEATQPHDLRGGEVLTGPRRPEKLQRTSSRILREMKKARVPFAKVMTRSGHVLKWTTPPPPKMQSARQRRRGKSASLVPATIDELFSGLRDHIHEGRSLECIVVAPPCSTGSSYSVLVEDSQREPAILAVYNAATSVVEQLVPGRVLQVSHPYVRIAADQSILLRVDDPDSTLHVGDLHKICWNCSVARGSAGLKSCAKCHRAKYCNRECQTADWQEFGHRYLCGRKQK